MNRRRMSCAGCRVKLRFYGQRALLLRKGDRVQQCAVVEASSSPASSFTFGQMASTASASCGLFASANRAETIARAREVLGMAAPVAEEKVEIDPAPAQVLAPPCPCCGGGMFIIETFEAGCAPRHGRPK